MKKNDVKKYVFKEVDKLEKKLNVKNLNFTENDKKQVAKFCTALYLGLIRKIDGDIYKKDVFTDILFEDFDNKVKHFLFTIVENQKEFELIFDLRDDGYLSDYDMELFLNSLLKDFGWNGVRIKSSWVNQTPDFFYSYSRFNLFLCEYFKGKKR